MVTTFLQDVEDKFSSLLRLGGFVPYLLASELLLIPLQDKCCHFLLLECSSLGRLLKYALGQRERKTFSKSVFRVLGWERRDESLGLCSNEHFAICSEIFIEAETGTQESRIPQVP